MQKGFVKQLQEAAEAGQVVLIPTPAKPAPRTSATPPPRHRDEVSLAATLCLMFKLRRSEGQVLMKMATQDFVSKDEIFTAAAQSDQTIADSTVSVLISVLRKKLLPRGIEIITLRGFGYGLRKESRKKICQQLSKYDAGLIPTTPPPEGRQTPPKCRATRTNRLELQAE
jgi:DNA-binding winged helix-turn-helix (wHTH) protein